jgi:hypothetical protein
MTLNTGLFNLCQRVALRNGGVTLRAFHSCSHRIGLRFLLSEYFSTDKLSLKLMTIRTFGCGSMMAAQALYSCLEDLPVPLSGAMTGVAVQDSCDMLSVGKRETIDRDLYIFKSLVALDALGVGHLCGLRQWNGSFWMTCQTSRLLSLMTFEAGFFRRPKGRRVVRIVIDIVVAGSTGVFQLLDMETVWNRDIIRVQIGRGLFDTKNSLVAANTVWVDLIKFGRKAGMLRFASKGKDVDARHQGMARRMTLRAINLGMHRRLFPKRRFPLLMMARDAKFLLGCRIGGERNGQVKAHRDQNPS